MHINPTVQCPHHLRQTPWYSLDNRHSHIRDRYCGEQHYPVLCSELNPGHRGDSCSIYESAQAQNQFRTPLQHEVKNCLRSHCRLGSLTSRPSLCVQDAAREVGCWLAGWQLDTEQYDRTCCYRAPAALRDFAPVTPTRE
jgi:hypothetical protein